MVLHVHHAPRTPPPPKKYPPHTPETPGNPQMHAPHKKHGLQVCFDQGCSGYPSRSKNKKMLQTYHPELMHRPSSKRRGWVCTHTEWGWVGEDTHSVVGVVFSKDTKNHF